MTRKWPLVCLIAGLAMGTGVADAGPLPILRSAKAEHHHVVVQVTVSDLQPIEFLAATRRTQDPVGALLPANVTLRETIKLATSASGVATWRTQKSLPPGTYYVQVMAMDNAGVTDCPPNLRNCLQHWSNVQRVVIR